MSDKIVHENIIYSSSDIFLIEFFIFTCKNIRLPFILYQLSHIQTCTDNKQYQDQLQYLTDFHFRKTIV